MRPGDPNGRRRVHRQRALDNPPSLPPILAVNAHAHKLRSGVIIHSLVCAAWRKSVCRNNSIGVVRRLARVARDGWFECLAGPFWAERLGA